MQILPSLSFLFSSSQFLASRVREFPHKLFKRRTLSSADFSLDGGIRQSFDESSETKRQTLEVVDFWRNSRVGSPRNFIRYVHTPSETTGRDREIGLFLSARFSARLTPRWSV